MDSPPLSNVAIAERFELLGDLLELEGAVVYRVLAYRRAAQTLRETAESVARLSAEGRLTSLPGVGQTIADFLYTPGDHTLRSMTGVPQVPLGTDLQFVNADGLARHVIGVAACEKTHDASHVRVFATHFLSQDRRRPCRSFPVGRDAERSELKRAFCSSLSEL